MLVNGVHRHMIKLYRRIFFISSIVSTISFVLSIALEFLRGLADVLSFFENYAIGIACSGALVAITTFIQFQSEYNKALYPFVARLSDLILYLYSAIVFENNPSAFERENEATAYDCLKTATSNVLKHSDITCLWRKKQNVFHELDCALISLRGDFIHGRTEAESVKAVTDTNRVLKIIDLALKVFPDGFEREDAQEFKKKLELSYR